MIEILKDRWCVEDQIRPSFGRKIKLEVDLYTDESVLKLPLEGATEEAIIELQIYGVNLGRELTYIKKEGYILVDLGDLKNWTSTPDSRGLIMARLKMQFRIIDPHFHLSRMDLGYETHLNVSGYKLDKGSIILPLGLKMENNGEIEIESFIKCGDKSEHFQEKYIADHVDIHNKKKRYNFSVKKDMQELVGFEDFETVFKVSYKTFNEKKFLIIPMVSVALLILALFRSYGLFTGATKFDIRYLAASVAFLGLILNFVRDGYELPLRKLIFFSVLILIIELCLELIVLPYG